MKLTIITLLFTCHLVAQTKNDVYNYLVEIGCKHPEIVTAQSILETGHYKSFSCKTRKNLFGLRYNHKYIIFDHWKESCHAYMSKVQYKYKGGDYYVFLKELGYASAVDYCKKLKKITTFTKYE